MNLQAKGFFKNGISLEYLIFGIVLIPKTKIAKFPNFQRTKAPVVGGGGGVVQEKGHNNQY